MTQKGLKEPYDWDDFAEAFFPKAQELASIASDASQSGDKAKASEYYLSVPWRSRTRLWRPPLTLATDEARQSIEFPASRPRGQRSNCSHGNWEKKFSTKVQRQYEMPHPMTIIS